MNELKTIALRPYSTGELAEIYGVHSKTFSKWLKPFAEEIGSRRGRMYSIVQVKIIFEKLGVPGIVREADIDG